MDKDADGTLRVSVNRDTAVSGKSRHFTTPSPRSVLTLIDDAELYPHVVGLASELSSWRFFHFEPDALRELSPAMDVLELEPTGRGLSGFYDTLASRKPDRYRLAERALRCGMPEACGIKVLGTGDRRRLLAVVREDQREFTARVLSDGTLRFLALLALAYAPQPPALVCFEEPENGVHPGRLPFVVDIRPPGREPVDDPRVAPIAAAARELVAKRDAWLNAEIPANVPGTSGDSRSGAERAEVPGTSKPRTLTALYNARPAWLDLAHRKLDAAVLDAYGWPADLSDEEVLARLLALNRAQAGQSAYGKA